jgi:hypothetical protein
MVKFLLWRRFLTGFEDMQDYKKTEVPQKSKY